MKILIVDDKTENLYMLEALLKGNGYEVVSAANGKEAFEKLRLEGADMIISDILMPVMDGFQLCQEVRGDETLKYIPFIFYTASYADEKDEEYALKIGTDKFLRKPMEPDEFIRIIQGVIRDVKEGKLRPQELALGKTEETFELYSERLVNKLEQKMLDLEAEIAVRERAEKSLQESENQVRLLLDSTAEGIYGLDMNGNCTFANRACIQSLGYKASGELISKNMYDLIHHSYPDSTPYPAQECQIFQAFKKREYIHVDNEVLWRADGTSFHAEYWSYPIIEDDQIKGAVVTFMNISARKKLEEELEQHRMHLEKRIRERTDELQTMVNLMAGREIRMAELKKVIKKLHTQIESEGLTPVANDPLKEAGRDYT